MIKYINRAKIYIYIYMIYRLSNTVCLLKRMKLSHVHHEDLDNVFMSRSKKNTSVGTEFFFTSESVA